MTMRRRRPPKFALWFGVTAFLALAAWAGAVMLMNAGVDLTLPGFARGIFR
jgi:hypothetical protein